MLSGRLSKRSAKRQKVIQPRAVPVFYPSAVLYSVGYSSRATGSLLVWRIRSLQTLLLGVYNVHAHAYGGDSRGIRICRSLVQLIHQSLLLYYISLYLAVMSLKKATVENAKGLHICMYRMYRVYSVQFVRIA